MNMYILMYILVQSLKQKKPQNSVNNGRLFFWAPKSLHMVIAAMKLKDAYSLEGKL